MQRLEHIWDAALTWARGRCAAKREEAAFGAKTAVVDSRGVCAGDRNADVTTAMSEACVHGFCRAKLLIIIV